MLPPSSLRVRRQGDQTFVRFAGLDHLDEYNSYAASEELSRLAETTSRALVLDLGNIRFVTGSALGRLVALSRRVRSAGGRLLLANLSRAVAEVIAVTHLDRVLEVCGGHAA